MTMTELVLPAGSLQAALHAFAGGADAVYLGLRHYSARKNAENFTFNELSRLKREAVRLGKRVYVALNTLVDDRELDGVVPLLRRLQLMDIDGVIVQDLGIASLVRTEFPSVPLHGSTQMAVHTVSGIRELQRLGFSRVVLSRELTLAGIAEIRQACPDIGLKVFIHGAMCYGVSGLCMASRMITGRSANRGECAQICRTWFSMESEAFVRRGYFFSMTDLGAGDDVIRLQRMGIDSLKVEGRMKSPAYVRAAARYYRMLLDGASDPEALAAAREDLDTNFARKTTGGWAFSYGRAKPSENRRGSSLTTVSYPGHLGVEIGRVLGTRTSDERNFIPVLLSGEVAVHDGLMILRNDGTGIEEPLRFSLTAIRDGKGRRTYAAKGGESVWISIPREYPATVGLAVYRISGHALHPKRIPETTLPPYRHPTDLTVTICTDALVLSLKLFPIPGSIEIRKRYPVEIQSARSFQHTVQNFREVFSASGEGAVTLGNLAVENYSSFPDDRLFFPLSRLKEIRRDWYRHVDEQLEKWIEKSVGSLAAIPNRFCASLPPRLAIIPPGNRDLPWVDTERVDRALGEGQRTEEVLAVVDGITYVPLAPVMFDEESYLTALDRIVERLSRVRVGINNIGQLQWARRNPGIPCFADVYLYMTNRMAASLFLDSVPEAAGMYGWVEREALNAAAWPCHLSQVGREFRMPLFISRSCYRYDSLGLPCEGCARNGRWLLEQNGKRYAVDVHNCLTVVSEQQGEA